MALEWVVLGYGAGAEGIMLLLLTMPALGRLRKGLAVVTRKALKRMLPVLSYCLLLLMDIYWKYETSPTCEGHLCSPSEHMRHQKSIMESQCKFMLIASALLLYWLLFCVTGMVLRIERMNEELPVRRWD